MAIRLETINELRTKVAAAVTEHSPERALALFMARIQAERDELSETAQFERLITIIQTLLVHAEIGGLTVKEIDEIVEHAHAILKLQGITQGNHKFAFLVSDLQLAQAQCLRKRGDHWQAAWLTEIGSQSCKRQEAAELAQNLLSLAICNLRLGNGEFAYNALLKAEALGLSAHALESARLHRAVTLRLCGQFVQAQNLAAQTKKDLQLSRKAQLELEWEAKIIAFHQSSDMRPLLNLLLNSKTHRSATYLLEGVLWTKAVSAKQWQNELPKADSIRRAFPEQVRRGGDQEFLFQCVQAIENCYDADLSSLNRLESLREAVRLADRIPTIDRQLLFLSAALRWLIRSQQLVLADMVAHEYQRLSRSLTNRLDCLQLFKTNEIYPLSHYDLALRETKVPLGQAPTGLARQARIARKSLGIAAIRMRNSINRAIFKDDGNEAASQIAEVLIQELSYLRGPIVKIGQVAALLASDLPEPIRLALESLYEQITPMDQRTIVEVFKQDFGKAPETVFARWDKQPFAAASLGQMHRAKLQNGQEVAVKIQYPKIRDVVRSDLKVIRMFAPFYRKIFSAADVDSILSMTEITLLMETDYVREANEQERMRENLAVFPNVIVPRVIREFSRAQVMTSEFVAGQRLTEFLKTGSQEDINNVMTTIFRVTFHGFLVNGVVNADPHPGNFMVTEDLRVACLDFGSVCELSPGRLNLWRNFFGAILDADLELFTSTLISLGIAARPEEFTFKEAFTNVKRFITPDADGGYSESAIRTLFKRMSIAAKNRHAVSLQTEDVLIPRLILCVFGLLAQSGAKGDWLAVMREVLAEDRPASHRLSG